MTKRSLKKVILINRLCIATWRKKSGHIYLYSAFHNTHHLKALHITI